MNLTSNSESTFALGTYRRAGTGSIVVLEAKLPFDSSKYQEQALLGAQILPENPDQLWATQKFAQLNRFEVRFDIIHPEPRVGDPK